MDLFTRNHRGAILLRLAAVIVGVGALLMQGPWRGQAWPAQAGLAAVIAIAVGQFSAILNATRFHGVLAANDLSTPWLTILSIHLQSMFYFFFVPMTVGLDLSRYAKLKQLHPQAAGTVLAATILLDRVVGVIGALAFTLLSLPLVALHTNAGTALGWQRGLAIVVAGLAALLALLAWPRGRRQLFDVWHALAPNWRRLGVPAALTAVSQAAFVYAVQQAAAAFGIEVGYVAALFAVSASMLAIIVPVSFAGAGPAEAACAGILAMLGLPAREALLVSGLVYGLRLVAALQGAAIEIAADLRGLHRPTPTRNLGRHG